MNTTKTLSKGRPDGYSPQRQRVRNATVLFISVSEYTLRISHALDEGVRDKPMMVYSIVLKKPGCGVTEIARKMGVSKGAVTNALMSMEDYGLLLYEDDQGKLYPFGIDALATNQHDGHQKRQK